MRNRNLMGPIPWPRLVLTLAKTGAWIRNMLGSGPDLLDVSAAAAAAVSWRLRPIDSCIVPPNAVLPGRTGCAQEVAKSRGGFGEERYEKEEFQNKVREYFDILRHEDKKLWQVIDADRPVEQVTEILGEIVVATVIKNMMLPLEDLWTDDPVAAAGGTEGEQTVVKGFEMLGFGRTPS